MSKQIDCEGNQLYIGHWIETDASLSAPIIELSEFAEFRWDGAGKLVSSKDPDRAIGND